MNQIDLEEELKKKKLAEDESDEDTTSSDEDDDQNFIRKDEPQEEKESEEKSTETKKNEPQGIFNKIKNFVFPKNNQQRNLDKETGGLEAEKDKGISEKDVWDDRSEQVDKMGSTDVFNTTGMRSVVWKKKRKRLEEAKQAAEAAAIGSTLKKNKVDLKDSFGTPTQSYVAQIKNMRQDRSTIDNGHGR